MADSHCWRDDVERALGAIGLNAVGVADGANYGSILPGCRSVIVFGSGGPALWDAFVEELSASPRFLTDELHPLDSFVRRAIDAADPAPPPSRRWVRCSADQADALDFRTLALGAGLGWPSALGLLLHPTYGPWLGLRAACFTTEALPATPPLPGLGPCETCDAPCASACPAAAIRLPYVPRVASTTEGGWQVDICARWNRDTDVCVSSCAARMACPVGAEHRYSPLERHYHQDRKSGRRALAETLAIADRREGIGPHWGAWAGES